MFLLADAIMALVNLLHDSGVCGIYLTIGSKSFANIGQFAFLRFHLESGTDITS